MSTIGPGECRLLSEMTLDEPVVQYLRSRGFGYEIAKAYNLHYCDHGGDCPAATGRLIFPVVMGGVQVGWQGRLITEPPSKFVPKYYTCPGMPVGQLLYNLDAARTSPFVVIVEGCFDALRLPHCSVALMGKCMSEAKLELLQQAFPGCPMVICLDPEVYASNALRIQQMIQVGHVVARIKLPPGVDPADLDPEPLWATIYNQAKAAGVRLPDNLPT